MAKKFIDLDGLEHIWSKIKSNFLSLTGNQTVGGVKTFTDSPKVERVNPYLDIVQTDITKGTPPSATSYAGVRFGGSDGANSDALRMGAVHHNYYANGANILRMEVTKPEAGSTETASVSVAYGADGVPYATAPTPASTDDNSTKIATTEWVQDKVGAVDDNVVHKTGAETISGAKTFASTIKSSVNLAIAKTDTAGGMQVCGGTTLADGGSLLAYGKNYVGDNDGEFAGAARLIANNGTDESNVLLFPDGRMRLDSGTIINFADNEEMRLFVDENGDMLLGDTSTGALLRIRSNNSTDNPGGFQFRAQDATNGSKYLIGKPDGTLTWAGKSVATFNSSGHLVLPDGSEFWIA